MIFAYWGQSIQRTTAQWRQWHPNVDEICPMTPVSASSVISSPSFPSHTCLCGYILPLTPTMRSQRYTRWMKLFQSFEKGQDQDQHCLLRQNTGHPSSRMRFQISNRAQQPPWAHSAFQNKSDALTIKEESCNTHESVGARSAIKASNLKQAPRA